MYEWGGVLGVIICFVVCFQTTYFGEEVSVLTGGGVIICFAVCLHTTYFCDDIILLTGACRWKHADGAIFSGRLL